MIKVVRIVGESFDLENGKEVPKSLVLSNGHREIHIVVGDEAVAEVVGLMSDLSESTSASPSPGNGNIDTSLDEAVSAVQQDLQQRVSPQLDDPAAEDTPSNQEDGEPGEEYDDDSTGTSSL